MFASVLALRRAALVALLGLLAACGGGGGSSAPPEPEPEEPIVETVGPGQFKSAAQLRVISSAEMAQAINAAGTRAPALSPRYAVTAWRLTYLTRDVAGREILASALIGVPVKPAGQRSPVLAYQHGTLFRDREAPSNNAVPAEPALLMASLGYIVVAADYVGYGASKGAPHPYLLSAPSASAVVDLITAAKYWRQKNRVLDNRQLFLAGYSEGGYVTMATHRALQSSASPHLANLVAVVPGAGPYSVKVTLDSLLELVRAENPLLAALIRPGALKNMSAAARLQLRNELLDHLLPDDADVSFDATFLDNFLGDETAEIERVSNVHDWKPALPPKLYHGRDDRTVPYPASTRTVAAMQAQGATGVTLTDCGAVPAGHLECVVPYWSFMLSQLAGAARDL
ncbi:prolyl oligopeptidase family serine peptidase [Aquincola sp. S2]|uniref:Prolyl oligopeptidase family serine peptidase n=1 Tax=Pseudaquabacterium terrae TaxID=2732868 RepID=A0ABX2EGZ6_9BURK|nr:alpha/beta fold hydrolase [Aquabacterium terrae]NRF67873.1 prolyl oligopeptidase family serine peptidase [Aquabacterium terrae]